MADRARGKIRKIARVLSQRESDESYAVGPGEFAKCCKYVNTFGADTVVLVDSAGGMLPDEIAEYTSAALAKTDIPLGFHGHNNFQLAIANCLAARHAGARVLDVSIRGMVGAPETPRPKFLWRSLKKSAILQVSIF